MASYRLSPYAERALEDIYVYTAQTFGDGQAEAYHEGFHRAFGLIADCPVMGRSADELRPGWRQHVHGKHVFFYTLADDGAVIVQAIFHTAQNVRKHMLDD